MTTFEIMKAAKIASVFVATASTEQKNNALEYMAQSVLDAADKILAANKADMEKAKGAISDVMLDRLMLNCERIKGMADGIRHVTTLPDPVGVTLNSFVNADGLKINKVSSPIGVIAIIYESRPNVTSDAAALAIKSGNACVLRCGKEAHESAMAITNALKIGLEKAGLPQNAVMLVEDTTRESANELMRANDYIDLLIPRGGAGLIKACVQNATVPCIETGTGICHVYVDSKADISKALNIIENAKTSRPSVCNAAEVLVVHKDILKTFIPLVEKRLVEERKAKGLSPVELRMDEDAIKYSKTGILAKENDYSTEFLDYILAVKSVDSCEKAVEHISAHSTHHSEAIVTEDKAVADYFTSRIDSAALYVNASTRFTDGGVFGLGCEMGISTQKLHARGPMGLCELTTYKYIIVGDGHIR